MRVDTKSEILQTKIFTFKKGEKKKAIEQCELLGFDIKYTESNKIVATKITQWKDIGNIISNIAKNIKDKG